MSHTYLCRSVARNGGVGGEGGRGWVLVTIYVYIHRCGVCAVGISWEASRHVGA